MRKPVDDEGKEPGRHDPERGAPVPPLEEFLQRAGWTLRTPVRKEGDASGDPADEQVDDAAREEPEPAEGLGIPCRGSPRLALATIWAGVNRSVLSRTTPAGLMIALTPTVEICTVALPCSIARSCDIASCCVDSSLMPKFALFVGITSISAPPATSSRMMSSYATSKQIPTPIGTTRPRRSERRWMIPSAVPGIMSVLTRSTAEENRRARSRSGMYSANGAGCCFA